MKLYESLLKVINVWVKSVFALIVCKSKLAIKCFLLAVSDGMIVYLGFIWFN
jgi:hypothetical protein